MCETKICSRCGEEKPLNRQNFRYREDRKVFEARCRKCQIEENCEYYWKNKEKVQTSKHNSLIRDCRSYLLRSARLRAKTKNLPFNLKIEDIVVPELCPVLGIPLKHGEGDVCASSPSLDRIIPELGYVVGNIQVISHKANTIKNNATYEEMCRVVEHMRRCMTRLNVP